MTRHIGGLRESELSQQIQSLLRGISSKFPLADHLALPGSESVFGLSQGPLTYAHLLGKMDSREEAYEWVDITYSLWSSKEPFCAYVVENVSLT